jgi:hypothetical protein
MSKDFPRGTDGKGVPGVGVLGGDGGMELEEREVIHDCIILSESLPEVGFVLTIIFESAVFFPVKPPSFRDGDLFVICDGYDWGFRYLVIPRRRIILVIVNILFTITKSLQMILA